MLYNKKKKLNFYLLGLLGSLTVTLNSYADNAVKGQVCGKPIFGVGYALTIVNESVDPKIKERASVGRTKCVDVQENDVICYKVFWGWDRDTKCFTVGKGAENIKFGSGIEARGTIWNPSFKIVDHF